MTEDYGHFADGSSAAFGYRAVFGKRPDTATNLTQEKSLPRVGCSFFERHFPIGSVDPELLLQARRRRRVLEHQSLVRIDVAVRLLGHQRAFVEAAQDQLQLAGIGVDVADRKNAGYAGLKSRGLDRHKVILKRNAPVRDRPEL